ncbi:MAG TPA: hypothetical protein VGC76_17375 [Pyrinomonadaceae bacterium]|jgi:hypothetical protein
MTKQNLSSSILLLICLTILSAAFIGAQTKSKGKKTSNAKSQIKKAEGKRSEKYPNELPDFRFYETSKWKTLEPLISTMADVRKILGKPSEANDVSQFTKPYPGDDKAKQPVFTYNLSSEWQVLIYFVKYCFQGYVPLPDSLDNKLCSIDLIPRKRLSFKDVIFPSVFKNKEESGADAAWIEYSDGTGLFYDVYTTRTAYGDEIPGDLNRIVYTASDETFKKYSTSNK